MLHLRIAQAVREAGGVALLIGGAVRDEILGISPKDHDLEVYGLSLEDLHVVLSAFGEIDAVGRSFGIFKIGDVDVSIPRRESKEGVGHKGFMVSCDPHMSIGEAARRRDFTINTTAKDPLTGQIFDPYLGIEDLKRRILRVTDPATFVEDPLRVLRGAQFIARLGLAPTPETVQLCLSLRGELNTLSAERVFEEMQKLLLKGHNLVRGFEFLERSGALGVLFPELAALIGLPQDAEWHPEGDVWTHTILAAEYAAKVHRARTSSPEQVMWGTLLHDLGKAVTTTHDPDGRIRSRGHEEAGGPIARALLERLVAPSALVSAVEVLVARHLAPVHFETTTPPATDGAYRRLARHLAAAHATIESLWRVADSDHSSRIEGVENPHGERFRARSLELAVDERPNPPVVLGRHLIARGFTPGPEIGRILAVCRDIQDESGSTDPDNILDRALAAPPSL